MGNIFGKWPGAQRAIQAIHESNPTIKGQASQDLQARGGLTTSTLGTSADVINYSHDHSEEEVGFPVRPAVPMRPMTEKLAVDLSWFLKEKGGLDGLPFSTKRAAILDMWMYNTQGIFPDWQNYTPGPGIRYPLCRGWLFKLVPVDPPEDDERNILLHPYCSHGREDPAGEGENLIWCFDSSLSRRHIARERYPEYFK
ncbi:nef protein [Simian immunodeficiency virus]|uniref:Protein Nef n=1 Tax=Simian immunodeficiency virus TaxID=11723 RepID=G1EH06_SIV|nr:nef protein [Simian immunodeficiency virus]